MSYSVARRSRRLAIHRLHEGCEHLRAEWMRTGDVSRMLLLADRLEADADILEIDLPSQTWDLIALIRKQARSDQRRQLICRKLDAGTQTAAGFIVPFFVVGLLLPAALRAADLAPYYAAGVVTGMFGTVIVRRATARRARTYPRPETGATKRLFVDERVVE